MGKGIVISQVTNLVVTLTAHCCELPGVGKSHLNRRHSVETLPSHYQDPRGQTRLKTNEVPFAFRWSPAWDCWRCCHSGCCCWNRAGPASSWPRPSTLLPAARLADRTKCPSSWTVGAACLKPLASTPPTNSAGQPTAATIDTSRPNWRPKPSG